ncbi:MAG: amidohydrolase family protein [Bacteroidales bacterium]|nr:amidohydrolase family protein [Bacteroidales bacterium]
MRKLSAQYIFTNNGPPLKRGVITLDDNGIIIEVTYTGGNPAEKESVEYFNGVIIPGFVNCHSHLELSHLKGRIPEGLGLPGFIKAIREIRTDEPEKIFRTMVKTDSGMYDEGIVLCADICNTANSFQVKKESRIHYINLIEVFGIDPGKADKRMEEFMNVAETAQKLNFQFSFVPHSAYSVSLPLLRKLKEICSENKVTSVHFMESQYEKLFLSEHKGPFFSYYRESGLLASEILTPADHISFVLDEITGSGNLILVHNTFADAETIRAVKVRNDLYWCLCPRSNIYIEGRVPPVDTMLNEGCEIVIGTDSMASNNTPGILTELYTLQEHFPFLKFSDLIRWATLNGARALGMDNLYGIIETGKKPGLLLIEKMDLPGLKLTQESVVRRLA